MAKRRTKRRTHLGAKTGPNGAAPPVANSSASRIPKSMVIRVGAAEVGPSVTQLVKDFRKMMEPHTASRLRERRSNRLRDYTTMAGPLGVSHLVLFSRSDNGNVNLRLALTPRGPTMHFRVESYSLCKDIKRAMRRPAGTSKEYTAPPLLVMNNFATTKSDNANAGIPKHLEQLSTSIFQSLFPAISPAATPLTSIQRVLLANRETPKNVDPSSVEESPYVLNLRHYAISTRRTGLPKAIRKINAAEKILTDNKNRRKGLPNLGKFTDVADYLLDPNGAGGFTSGSESEPDTDAEVEVLDNQARKVISRKKAAQAEKQEDKKTRVEKRAIKLSELGPRMKLRLTKVEEGVCGGKVMWHEWIKKSHEEEKQQDRAWDDKRKLKEERKRLQKENVAKKKGKTAADTPDDDLDDDWDSEDLENDDENMPDEEGEGEDEGEDEEMMVPRG